MSLPSNYKEGVTRVTSIVSFKFPFKWTDWERRYLGWLKKNWIKQKEYLEGAQSMWTTVHNALENYIIWWDYVSEKETEKEIEHWIKWLDESWYKKIETELYVREENDLFQGSVDLLYTDKEWKIVLADWKTFGIVKKRYGLPNKFTVATDKRKKVRLQMSLYAYALRQKWIIVDRLEILFLHEEGIKVVELIPMNTARVEKVLTDYSKQFTDRCLQQEDIIITKTRDMKVKLHKPTEQYWFLEIEIDGYKLDDWQTLEDKIDEAKALINYTLKK